MSALRIVPCDFPTAVAFVAMHHRHHQPPVGHKFSIGLADNDELVGVAIVGRPVARAYQDGLTLEVTRTAVAESIPNGNSMLYGAAWRAAKALGYRRLITYTQEGESGASLRGAGWRVVAQRKPRPGWDMPSRRRTPRGTDNIARTLWEVAEAGIWRDDKLVAQVAASKVYGDRPGARIHVEPIGGAS